MTKDIPAHDSEKPCNWIDSKGYCWLNMPDSKLPCTGKCSEYWYKNGDYVGNYKCQ